MKKLRNLGKSLSRYQQSKITGGLNEAQCCSTAQCSVFQQSTGHTYYGTCGVIGGGAGVQICECDTQIGVYEPSGGTSHCVVPCS